MDEPTRSIVDFVAGTTASSMSALAVRAVVRNYVDCVGCAGGGFYSRPALVTRRLASHAQGVPAASTYGLDRPSLIEFAVFANATATRFADYNDVDVVSGAGHPSDMSPALMGMAEAIGVRGSDLVCAMYVAYEVMGALGSAVTLRDRGWDQGLLCSLGAVAGLAKLIHLSDIQLASAIAIAVTPSIPLRVTRAGNISDWKGAATAHATMTATMAVRLAKEGMTGPDRVFDGIEGVFEKVTGPFELRYIGPAAGELSVAERVQHKYFPVIAESQGPVQQMLQLRKEARVEDIASIALSTEYLGWHEGGGGQGDAAEKWDPQTRETADHSLPYVMAAALIDGRVTVDTFLPERVRDPALRPLMKKISVAENKEYTDRRASHGELISVTDVKLRDGRTLRYETRQPRGHRDNPMSDEELGSKFDSMIEKVLPTVEHAELRERLWNLPDEKRIDQVTSLFRKFGKSTEASPGNDD
jgi:2-methylcitrate dehydratase